MPNKYGVSLNIWISDTEASAHSRAAQISGLSLQDYIRSLLALRSGEVIHNELKAKLKKELSI